MPAPVLAGNTLAWPSEYENNPTIRAGTQELLDGSLAIDVANSALKRTFTMAWVVLTSTQKNLIATAYSTIVTAPTSNNFTDTDSNTYSVVPMEGVPPMNAVAINTAKGICWNVRLTFKEA